MKKRSPTSGSQETGVGATPAYEQISSGLTRLLREQGQPVGDGFPPGKRLSRHDPATGELVLHPWLPRSLRAELLLDAAVDRLESVEYERRLAAFEIGDGDEDEAGWHDGDDEPWRAPVVKAVAGRALGLAVVADRDELANEELSPGEQSAVALLLAASTA